MAKTGLAECEECVREFEDGDTVYECGVCDQIFCKKCWEVHNCLDTEFSEPTLSCDECDECDREEDSSDLKNCDECGKIICEGCWDKHCQEHLINKVEEWNYEEYCDQKILKGI